LSLLLLLLLTCCFEAKKSYTQGAQKRGGDAE